MKKVLLIIVFLGFQITIAQVQDSLQEVASGPKVYDSKVFNTAGVEVPPEFPGGIQNFYKYVGASFRVPSAKEFQGGKIYIQFVVEKDGSLTDIKVLRDVGFGTGQEAIRVLTNCPKWSPAMQKGKLVRCQFVLPITIRLN